MVDNVYERGGNTICTKLAVCNKFNECDNTYVRGSFKDPEDIQSGAPADTTPKVAIKEASLSKHVCLTQFGLVGQR